MRSDSVPTDEQQQKITEFLSKKYGNVRIKFIQDREFTGGFRIEIGDEIYDWTNAGRLHQLKKAVSEIDEESDEDIIPLIKNRLAGFTPTALPEEEGTVLTAGDGIATVIGLSGTVFGEILLFTHDVIGMVLDLNDDTIGCVLFDEGGNVHEGSRVHRTGKAAGIPVGSKFCGRVINALGAPIDGGGDIISDHRYTLEWRAPEIIERQPVCEPLETGILAIDSMFPIGKGQRELIIGDRQTGKTSIAIDTIINQKDKNVVCIYVAIGQKASSIAAIVNTLREKGAMKYTTVVASFASDSASLQYIAPYAGCTLAEYFMDRGRDVLIVYDDLSKHAVAYRTLSLLLGRTPGREAYPGDIFYLHSRLLERSAHLSDGKGGGSMTALPIVETQDGDVASYIPTNVISITDGQLFLETDLFREGQRPAVNVGLSVSRVGGAAQSQAMKKTGRSLRLELAQYREIAVFSRFAGDLDNETTRRLEYGASLMKMLRQKKSSPFSRHKQIIVLLCGTEGFFTGVRDITADIDGVTEICEKKCSDICAEIEATGRLSDSDRERLTACCRGYFTHGGN